MKNNQENLEKKLQEFTEENENLRQRLAETEEVIEAIQNGEVDALLMNTENGKEIYSLEGADYSYRVLVETMEEGAVTIASDFTIMYSNDRFAKLVKLPGTKIVGKSITQFIHKDDLPHFFPKVNDRNPEKNNIELRLIDSKGDIIPVFLSSNPLSEEKDAFWLIFTELTELKKSQNELAKAYEHLEELVAIRTAELARSEEKASHLIKYAPTAIYEIDFVSNRFISVNDAMSFLSGYSKEELLAMNAEYLLDNESKYIFQERINNWITGNRTNDEVEYKIKAKDGHVIYALLNVHFKVNEQGIPVSAIVVGHDITERKNAETALHLSEQRFKTILNNSIDITYRADYFTGEFDYISPSCRKITGYIDVELKQLGDWNSMKIVHPDDVHAFKTALIILDAKRKASVEYRLLTKEGEYRWVLNTMEVIYDTFNLPLYRIGNIRDINEQKLAKEKLRASEQELMLVVDTVPALIVYIDTNFHYRRVNEGYNRWFGFKPHDMIGKHVKDVMGNTTWEIVRKRLELAMSGETITYEELMPYKKGGHRWVSTTIVPDFDDKGIVRGCVGHVTDITERKNAEQTLIISEEKYKELVNQARGLIFNQDTQGRFTFVNEFASEYFGYTEEEFIGKTAIETITPKTDSKGKDLTEMVENIYANPDSYSININENIKKNGERVWIEWHNKALFDNNGNRQGHICVGFDITERKQAEEKLEESEKKYRELVKHAPTGIWEIDFRKNKFTTVNDAMSIMSGYSREELLSMHADAILVGKSKTIYKERLRNTLNGENSDENIEYKVRAKDGHIINALLNSNIKYDEHGNPVGAMVVAHDITERKSMELQLRYQSDILQSVNDAVIVTDLSYKITSWNKPAERMYGYVAAEVMGRLVKEVVQTQTEAEKLAQIYQTIQEGQPLISEHIQITKQGHPINVECNSMPLLDSEGKTIGYVTLNRNITDRKQTEEALRESENRYHQMFDRHHAIKLVIDPETGAIVDANSAALKYYGYSFEQICSLHIQDINQLPPEEVEEEYKKAMAEQRNYFVFPHRLSNGEMRWVEVFSSPVQNKGRQLLYSIIHDVTARKKAEEAIANSEREFRLLTESMPQIVWTTTADGLNTYFNHQWIEYTGMTLEESYGTGWNKPFHPEDQQRAWHAWQNAVQNNAAYLLQCRLRRADGVYRWWLIHGVPVIDENGTITKWYGTCTDIDDMRKAEDALRLSEERFRLALKNAPIGVAIQDKNLVYQWAYNQRSRNPEDIIGKTDADLFAPEDLEWIIPLKKEILETGKENYVEKWLTSKGQKFFLGISYEPLRDSTGAITSIGMATIDFTEKKLAEIELENNNIKLAEINSTKDKFFKIIAHDMKNPFITLIGASELLHSHANTYTSEKVFALSKLIHEASKSGYDMLLNLLEWAKTQSGSMSFQPELIDLERLIFKDLSSIIDNAGNKEIKLKFDIDFNLKIKADRNMLETILRNLISNAVKFTPRSGEVTVKTEKDNDALIFSVKDSGIGIHEKDVNKLFRNDVRYTIPGTEHEGGTGLGLILCKEFVERHGGKIWVKSKVKKGSTFFFTLKDVEN